MGRSVTVIATRDIALPSSALYTVGNTVILSQADWLALPSDYVTRCLTDNGPAADPASVVTPSGPAGPAGPTGPAGAAGAAGPAGAGAYARGALVGQPMWVGPPGYPTPIGIPSGNTVYTAFVIEKKVTVSHLEIRFASSNSPGTGNVALYDYNSNGTPRNRLHALLTPIVAASQAAAFPLPANMDLLPGLYWYGIAIASSAGNVQIMGALCNNSAMPINSADTAAGGFAALQDVSGEGLPATVTKTTYAAQVLQNTAPQMGLRIVTLY